MNTVWRIIHSILMVILIMISIYSYRKNNYKIKESFELIYMKAYNDCLDNMIMKLKNPDHNITIQYRKDSTNMSGVWSD